MSSLRSARKTAGLTQAELARRAGVSRQLVGAVEAGRHLPRVDAALALAAALDADVAALFGPQAVPCDVLTGEPAAEGLALRSGLVGDVAVAAPAGATSDGWVLADAVVEAGEISRLVRLRPGLVVAGCEPGLRALESLLRERGMAAVAVGASSLAARRALDAGRTHAAVVHGPPDALRSHEPYVRVGIARWQVGVAALPDAGSDWWRRALSGTVPVVQREPGAGVQDAFERAVADPRGVPVPGPRVGGHLDAVRQTLISGLPSVTIEPAALAGGAAFHALEVHAAELLIAPEWLNEPAVTEALDALAGRRFVRRLELVGGYDLSICGVRLT